MHVSERLLAYFEQITGVQGGHVSDAASRAFAALGFSGALSDQWFAFLRASGYEGARPDMYSSFLADLEAGDASTPTYAGLPDWLTITRSTEGSYRDADTLIKWAGVDEPRFDHTRSGVPTGLLVEPQRTNYALWSCKPATAVSNGAADRLGVDLISNSIPDPAGGTDGIRVETAGSEQALFGWLTASPAGDAVASQYAYDADRESILAVAINLGAGYFRVHEYDCGCRIQVYADDSPGNLLCGGGYVEGLLDPDIGDKWSVWGGQLEIVGSGEAALASSLIRTEGTAVTRQPDTLVCADSDWEALYRPIDGSPQQWVQVDAGAPFTGFGHVVAVRKI